MLVYCDRAWGSTGARASIVLILPSGIKLHHASRLQFTNEADRCTNNIDEYEAILLGIHKLRAIEVQTYVPRTDLKVMLGQVEKECITREATLEKYLALTRRMESHFKGFTVGYIERNINIEGNELVKAKTHNIPLHADVFFQVMGDASVKTIES
jgi:ribonuclease HI